MSIWITDLFNIAFAVVLVFVNGFFVATEFALVKVRPGRIDELIRQRRIFAATAKWLLQRLDASLSACQLGITMASLGLGWIGEPAVAHLLRPVLQGLGVVSEMWMHGIAFAVAFSGITAAHLVLGEQAPKIYALRRPEIMLLWCALPLKFFYFLSYPFMDKASRVVKTGDRFELEGAAAEVLEMKGSRASRIQLTLQPGNAPEP